MKRILAMAAAALLAATTLPAFTQTMEGGTEGGVIIEEDGMEGGAEGSATIETDPGTTASIGLSAEQETEMHTILSENASPTELDVELSIGAAVPETVTLQPLPPRFIEVVPDYEGYKYFVLADGRIVIVEPETHEVVYILS